ncbi:MAG: hypothetical protein ACJ79A_18920 [Gemmatimonadaceae bacterium]
MIVHRSVLVLLASSLVATSAAAQGDASVVCLVRVRGDTLAVERATISARRAESAMRLRTPPALVRQVVVISASGDVEGVSTAIGRGANGDSAIKRLDVTVAGDSGTAQPFDASAPAPLPARRLAVPRGAVPFVNLSGLSLELMLRRARAIGGDSADVPLLLGNGGSMPARPAGSSAPTCRRRTWCSSASPAMRPPARGPPRRRATHLPRARRTPRRTSSSPRRRDSDSPAR